MFFPYRFFWVKESNDANNNAVGIANAEAKIYPDSIKISDNELFSPKDWAILR